ncbi:MAG: hypothetical protein CMJ83_13240 [Planctomycetes bacterium]|nr:hypothetical protein [Planctomycetota bacterium]
MASFPDPRTPDVHAGRFALDIALGDSAGPIFVLGEPPAAVMYGVAAAGAGIVLSARPEWTEPVSEGLDPWTPAWIDKVGPDEVPEIEGGFGAVVIWDAPSGMGADDVEAALATAADGAAVHLSLPIDDASTAARLDRLVRGACAEGVVRPGHAPPGRLVLQGVRRTPGEQDREIEVGDPVPVTVVIVHDGTRDLGLAEATLCDVLLRQVHAPADVVVLDVARDSARLPETLFGFPAASRSRVMLVPRHDGDLPSGVNDVLGGVQQPFTALLQTGDRLAPHHAASLGLALEPRPGAAMIVAAGARFDVHGRVAAPSPPPVDAVRHPRRSLLCAQPFLPPATLWRTSALHALEGVDPALGDAALDDLWARAPDAGLIVAHPSPLAGRIGWRPAPLPAQVLAALVSRTEPTALAGELAEIDRGAREAAARSLLLDAALIAGRADLAEVHLEALDAPSITLRLRHALLRDDLDLAETLADQVDDPLGSLVAARVLLARGRRGPASSRVDELVARHPDLEAAYLLQAWIAASDPEPVRALIALRAAAGADLASWLITNGDGASGDL